MKPVLIVHGGAGPARAGDAASGAERAAALERAVAAAFEHLPEGALGACVAAVAELEDCPLLNAGMGSVLARDGGVWCDAAVMTGDGRAGAVAAVRGVRNPIRAARALLDEGETLLWAGQSEELVARYGLRAADPEQFVTPAARARLEAHLAGCVQPQTGTVGAVCLDAAGELAAATSTGGRVGKHPGRVGDSALVGAGTWADARTCAVSATGAGEAFIRAVYGHEVHARMLLGGASLAEASAGALEAVRAAGGLGGAICVSAGGEIAMPCTDAQMGRAWRIGDGPVRSALEAGTP
ncbi:MAG TPA: isoaspartyl peptidase/L-asparaginase [Solirubrobacteraceae bacterium]|nr:isoaspartyl peptidase/L-asparaginase [Solirubrobacteraceae bacterium]